MTFLFATALLALPLAGLPILLHLLFRKKSPIVHFPTLRFIKTAIQHTAARRKIQRWLLLACRILLLALLIWAIAQPARQLASAWMTGGESSVAVIVVDTSYSMLLQPDPSGGTSTLLDRADAMIQDLLRDQLKSSRVAIFRSLPPPKNQAETFREVGAIQKDWTALKPQPSPVPLAHRIDAALDLLKNDAAPQKWLFILTDLQSREFHKPIQAPADIKTVLLDLHPDEPRSAGITTVAMDPEDPLPGIGSEAVIEIAGRAGDSRAVTLAVSRSDTPDAPLLTRPPIMAGFDSGGRSQLRFPLRLPVERFMLVRASLQAQDALPWDNQRDQLVAVPARQPVTLLETAQTPANKFLRLALDASEGASAQWPLALTRSPNLTGSESVVALNLTQWPDSALANRLATFVKAGGTLLLCLQPGLEESFKSLPDDVKRIMLELLPSSPTLPPTTTGAYRAASASLADPLMKGLTDKKFDLSGIIVRRFVPLLSIEGRDASPILSISPANPGPGARTYPLLARRKLASGIVYTLATQPDPRYTNLPTHPLFLPLAVRMSLRAAAQRDVQNVELGQPLQLTGPQFNTFTELQIASPTGENYIVKPTGPASAKQFTFDRATEPGVYTWRSAQAIVALSNVQLPSAEADLTYRPARSVLSPTETHLIARSLPDLQTLLAKATEPQPKWALPIAIVMLLLCLEALMASTAKLWKPLATGWFSPTPA